MTDLELDELIDDEEDGFIRDPYLDFDMSLESMCSNCGDLGSIDACQCCGGPLCHICHECSAGFCDECLKSPDFSERMAELYAEIYAEQSY